MNAMADTDDLGGVEEGMGRVVALLGVHGVGQSSGPT